jgi:hypothetical protein
MFSLDAQLMMTSMSRRRTLRYVFQIVETYTRLSVVRQNLNGKSTYSRRRHQRAQTAKEGSL